MTEERSTKPRRWSALRRFYETGADGDAGEFPRYELQLAQLRGLADRLPPTPRFLDLGCASGAWTTRVASTLGADQVVGVDLSTKGLLAAARRGVHPVYASVDGAVLPFASGSLDVVMCDEVIEHVVDTDGLLDEIHRVLHADGMLVLSTPNLAAWFNRLALLAGIQPAFSEVGYSGIYGRPGTEVVGHLRLFTWRALREFLAAHGFTVVSIQGAPYHDLPSIARPLDRLATKLPAVAADLMVVARP
ncbi:MAG: methyltransferase domain-containing protein [Acidimicrobiia bacterium]